MGSLLQGQRSFIVDKPKTYNLIGYERQIACESSRNVWNLAIKQPKNALKEYVSNGVCLATKYSMRREFDHIADCALGV